MPRYVRETAGNVLGGVSAYLAPDLKCCPWPSCWAEPAGIEPYAALCSHHQLKPTAGGCAFGRCPRDALGEPLCAYHDKLARGLIDPMGHDPMRQRVLAVLPRRSGTRGRMTGADLLQRKRELGLPIKRSWIEAAERNGASGH